MKQRRGKIELFVAICTWPMGALEDILDPRKYQQRQQDLNPSLYRASSRQSGAWIFNRRTSDTTTVTTTTNLSIAYQYPQIFFNFFFPNHTEALTSLLENVENDRLLSVEKNIDNTIGYWIFFICFFPLFWVWTFYTKKFERVDFDSIECFVWCDAVIMSPIVLS